MTTNATSTSVKRYLPLVVILLLLFYILFPYLSPSGTKSMTIRSVELVQGACPAAGTTPTYVDYVFRNESFSIVTTVNIDSTGTYKQLKIATGIDSRGAHGQTLNIDSTQSGEVVVCAEGFMLDWPMLAALRVELFEEGVWKSRVHKEYAVVHRDRAEAVFMPLFSHTSFRLGFPRRVQLTAGDQLVMQAGVYVANGTAEPVTLGPQISGDIYGMSSWTATLDAPITVEPFSVSEVSAFLISTNELSTIGQKLQNDKIIMLAKLQGDYTSPGRTYDDTDVLDWKTLNGIGVDLVFVGDFSTETRQDVYKLVNNEVNGYLQRAQIKLHGSEKRLFTAEQLNMSSAEINDLKDIADHAECARLSAYQPEKGRPRLTIYFTEGLFSTGFVGCYPTGGPTPIDANTPFRSPIVRLNTNALQSRSGSGAYYGGREFFASVIAHEVGHALGLSGHTDSDSCPDTDHTLAADTFNLMFFGEASYSRILTPCQVNTLRNHSQFFRY